MSRRNILVVALIFACPSLTFADGESSEPIITTTPVIFAPGVVSGPANDGAPAIAPDGKTLYFGRAGGTWGFILESHMVSGQWSEPVIASFSGQWSDSQPALSPDGSLLIFQSTRPAEKNLPPEQALAARRSSFWQVKRTANSWSEPERLPDTVNISPSVWKPSIAADGSIYFMAKTDDNKTWRLFKSSYVKGSYEKAIPLSFSDGNSTDVDPEIAPDQSFLIFSSAGRTPGDTHEHLFITFREGNDWGAITPLRYEGDYAKNPADDGEAHLSPDLRTVYFNSGRTVPVHYSRTRAEAAEDFKRLNLWDNSNSNAWSISIAPWLDAHKAAGFSAS